MLKVEFRIAEASPIQASRDRVIEMCIQSQEVSGVPNPEAFPPEALGDYVYNGRDNLHLLAIHKKTEEIIGHIAVEEPNPENLEAWYGGIKRRKSGPLGPQGITPPLLELGGLFVDPNFRFRGVGQALTAAGLSTIEERSPSNTVAVAATWTETPFAKKIVKSLGGRQLSIQEAVGGSITLWAFNQRRR